MARRNRSTDSNGTTIAVGNPESVEGLDDQQIEHTDVIASDAPPTRTITATATRTTHDSYVRAVIVLARGGDKPEAKLAEATLEFVAGTLDGLVVCGFTVWEDQRRGIRVSGPGRKWTKDDGKGGQKDAFFPFVRSADPGLMGLPAKVRGLIENAYHEATAKALAS